MNTFIKDREHAGTKARIKVNKKIEIGQKVQQSKWNKNLDLWKKYSTHIEKKQHFHINPKKQKQKHSTLLSERQDKK